MPIKILQWNIWINENISNVISFINEVSPDIACLQELTGKTPEFISKSCNFTNLNYHDAQTWETKKGTVRIGDGVFSKFPMLDSSFSYLHLPKIGSTKYNEEGRVYVQSNLDIFGRPLTVGTTHLSYEPWFIDSPVKLEELSNLEKIIENKTEHFILTGDFNSPPQTKIVSTISKYLKNLAPPLNENTWTTKPFKNLEFSEEKLNWRLDHIFGTTDIKVIESQILKTNFSDHLPIMVTFDF